MKGLFTHIQLKQEITVNGNNDQVLQKLLSHVQHKLPYFKKDGLKLHHDSVDPDIFSQVTNFLNETKVQIVTDLDFTMQLLLHFKVHRFRCDYSALK